MTDIDILATGGTAHGSADGSVAPTDEHRLTLVLRVNAATSVAAGLFAAVAPDWVADRLGLGSGGADWTRIVGIGLVVFAAAVAFAAQRLHGTALRRAAIEVSTVDLAWVAATVFVVAAAELSGLGIAVAIVMGAGVLGFAVLQLSLARRITA